MADRRSSPLECIIGRMKLEPHLPQLPSIGELLEHPRVKGVVARINRSTLAQRAAGFLEEWRLSLAERAGRMEIPSVTELADRLARRLLGEPSVDGSVINATGVIVGDSTLAPPLADAAVHVMMQVAGEYHGRETPLHHRLVRQLCQLTGAEAALAVSSYDAALTLVLAATAANREALVCGDASASAVDWQWLAARSGVIMRTVAGDRNEIASAITGSARLAAVVRCSADGAPPMAWLSEVARQRDGCVIDAAGDAGLLNPSSYGFPSVDTIGDYLTAGADVVIVDAAGLIGGPTCGVIVGKRQHVTAAAEHPLASLLAIDPLSAAGLHATLAAYREDKDQSVVFALPMWQLLSAPLANLKQRAERLAPLIGHSPAIASSEAVEIDSVWRRCGSRSSTAKSWAIALLPRAGDAQSLIAQLRRESNPILGAEADGAVRLDLRTVFPRWDQQLVAAVESAGVH